MNYGFVAGFLVSISFCLLFVVMNQVALVFISIFQALFLSLYWSRRSPENG